MDALSHDAWRHVVNHMDCAKTVARFRTVCRLASQLGAERQHAERQLTTDIAQCLHAIMTAYVDDDDLPKCVRLAHGAQETFGDAVMLKCQLTDYVELKVAVPGWAVRIWIHRTQYTHTSRFFQVTLYTQKPGSIHQGSCVTLRLLMDRDPANRDPADEDHALYIEMACSEAAHLARIHADSERTRMRVLASVSPSLIQFYKLVFEAMPVWSRGATQQRVLVSIGSVTGLQLCYRYTSVWDMMDWIDQAKLEAARGL